MHVMLSGRWGSRLRWCMMVTVRCFGPCVMCPLPPEQRSCLPPWLKWTTPPPRTEQIDRDLTDRRRHANTCTKIGNGSSRERVCESSFLPFDWEVVKRLLHRCLVIHNHLYGGCYVHACMHICLMFGLSIGCNTQIYMSVTGWQAMYAVQ